MSEIGAHLEVVQPQTPNDFGHAKNTCQERYKLAGRLNGVDVGDIVPD